MNIEEILVVILCIIELATISIFYNLWKHEKKKRLKEKDIHITLEAKYCDEIEELKNNPKNIEKYELQREVNKLTIENRELKENADKVLSSEIDRLIKEAEEQDRRIVEMKGEIKRMKENPTIPVWQEQIIRQLYNILMDEKEKRVNEHY